MSRRRPASSRHICAPTGYPLVHDCGRPETCTDTDRVWGCEVPACPPADAPGTVYWVGEERELWTLGADHVVHNAAGEPLPMAAAVAELTRRGARIQYLPNPFGAPSVRADIGAPLVRASRLPEQLDLWRAA